MWLPCEVFNDLARNNIELLKKGARIHVMGTLLFNKWIDKNTGEDRKQFRFRIQRFIPESQFLQISQILNTGEMVTSAPTSSQFSSIGKQPSSKSFPSAAASSSKQTNQQFSPTVTRSKRTSFKSIPTRTQTKVSSTTETQTKDETDSMDNQFDLSTLSSTDQNHVAVPDDLPPAVNSFSQQYSTSPVVLPNTVVDYPQHSPYSDLSFGGTNEENNNSNNMIIIGDERRKSHDVEEDNSWDELEQQINHGGRKEEQTQRPPQPKANSFPSATSNSKFESLI
jgi:single-stranded DNA-binding protein